MHATTKELREMVKRAVEWEMEEVPFVEGVEYELRLLTHVSKMDQQQLEDMMHDEVMDRSIEYAGTYLADLEESGSASGVCIEKVQDLEYTAMMDKIREDNMHIVECCERIRFAVECQIKTILGEK